MEAPRRRETFTSLQLQRASDQLQEAIQSARRGRSSRATSLSLLSDLSGSGYSSSDHDDDHIDDDQENQPQKANAQPTPADEDEQSVEKPTPEQKLRRFMAESMGSTGRRVGASLSLKDLLASPLRDDGASARKLQLAGESESGCNPEKDPAVDDDMPLNAKTGMQDDLLESQARKAIDVLQRDVETQARANRDVQEQLKHVVLRLNGFVERVVGHAFEDPTTDQKSPLCSMMVEKLGEKWMEALVKWEEEMISVTCSHEARIRELEEKMEQRVREMEQSFQQERDAFNATISVKASEASDLHDTLNKLHKANADEKEEQQAVLRQCQLDTERLHMQNEDLLMRLQINANEVPNTSAPSAEAQERHILDLLSQLKQFELRELHWEMLCEEQTEAALQTQERLNMLLEDVNSSKLGASATDQTFSNDPSVFVRDCHCADRRTSFASSTASGERHMYQQRIELLEGQLSDLKEQINCDHHQFLYEQQKWDLEKKHLGHDVEEVHGVSVKVLKLLLIRERLLKKQEKKAQQRRDKLENDELRLREKQDAIHTFLETALQECGVALLYVRQLAMAVTTQQSPTKVPVKPIKLVRVIKRLKSLQQDVATASIPSANSPTTSASTWTSRVASSDHQPLHS